MRLEIIQGMFGGFKKVLLRPSVETFLQKVYLKLVCSTHKRSSLLKHESAENNKNFEF